MTDPIETLVEKYAPRLTETINDLSGHTFDMLEWEAVTHQFRSAIREAIEGERERCAKVADEAKWAYEGGRQSYEERRLEEVQYQTCDAISAAIRSLRS